MMPRIKSGQAITVIAIEDYNVLREGDVVLCKVRGTIRLHLVSAINRSKRRVQISNNHGYVNGWTSFDQVYGVMQG